MKEENVIDALLNFGFSRRYIKKLIRGERGRRRAALKERRKELKESAIKKLLHNLY